MINDKLIDYLNQNNTYAQFSRIESRKLIIIIEPHGSILSVMKSAKELNYELIVLSAHTGMRLLSEQVISVADWIVLVDTQDIESIKEVALALSRKNQICAVIPGFEYYVEIAMHIAKLFKLPSLSNHTLKLLRRKDFMRAAMAHAKLTTPYFEVVTQLSQLKEDVLSQYFPLIVKPIDAAGSVYVSRCDSFDEVYSAVRRILEASPILWGHSVARSALIESYIDGDEYSVEGLIQNGQVVIYSITKKFLSDDETFTEVGHIVNCNLETCQKNAIKRYVMNLVEVLQLDHIPFHAELKLTSTGEPILIEMAGRLAGDKITDLINLISDTNYHHELIKVYTGNSINLDVRLNGMAGIRFFYRPAIETFDRINSSYLQQSDYQEMTYYYSSGQVVPAFPIALRRLGHVIAVSDDEAKLSDLLQVADQATHFVPSVSNEVISC